MNFTEKKCFSWPRWCQQRSKSVIWWFWKFLSDTKECRLLHVSFFLISSLGMKERKSQKYVKRTCEHHFHWSNLFLCIFFSKFEYKNITYRYIMFWYNCYVIIIYFCFRNRNFVLSVIFCILMLSCSFSFRF